MAIPKVGDFYINNANQDFYLRELVGGIPTWVRKGNIRDDGTSGLLSVAPNVALGFNLSVQVDRIRFLGSIAFDYGFAQTNNVSRIRQIAAAFNLGFDEVATVGAINALAAQFNLGFDQAVALFRTQQISDAHALGFSLAASVTHVTPAPSGYAVVGLGASPWSLWYDGSLTNLTPSWTVPAAAVTAAVFSPDGTQLVLATASALFRYDTSGTTPVYLGALSSPPSWAHIDSLSFNFDGSRLAVLDSQLSPFCWVYNTSTWTTVTAPAIATGSQGVRYDGTANAHLLSAEGNATVKLWDTPGMGASATQPGTQTSVISSAIDFSPNGAYFAVDGGATPSPFRVWKMTSLGAPLASPATMPHTGASTLEGGISWNHASTKLVVCDVFGTYCYSVSGTTITLDQTINFNVIGGGVPRFKSNDTKLYLTQRGGTPRFAVYDISGNTYTAGTGPTVQPATDPTALAVSI